MEEEVQEEGVSNLRHIDPRRLDLSLVRSLPDAKVLNVKDMVMNNQVVKCLMIMFPKPTKVNLWFAQYGDLEHSLAVSKLDYQELSTEVALQLLEYLVTIPSFRVRVSKIR